MRKVVQRRRNRKQGQCVVDGLWLWNEAKGMVSKANKLISPTDCARLLDQAHISQSHAETKTSSTFAHVKVRTPVHFTAAAARFATGYTSCRP